VLEKGGRLFPSSTPLRAAQATLNVSVAPPVPVNVRLRVEGRHVRCWAEDAQGQLLPDRPLLISLSGGTRTAETKEAGVTSFEVQGSGAVTVSVADRETGVTALAEAKP
jgi:hypothetical protein